MHLGEYLSSHRLYILVQVRQCALFALAPGRRADIVGDEELGVVREATVCRHGRARGREHEALGCGVKDEIVAVLGEALERPGERCELGRWAVGLHEACG